MADKRPAIGLDLDGVCAQFSPKFIQMANKEFGLNLKPEDQTDWDFHSLGLTEAQCGVIYNQIHEYENFWMKLDPMPFTSALSAEMDKYRIYFITSRMSAPGLPLEDQTAHWIRTQFYIPNPTVIVTNNKGEVAKALELDYFLDDRPENCLDVIQKSYAMIWLHDAPYNQTSTYRRAKTLNEFFSKIGGL